VFVRNLAAEELLELFMVMAVAAVIVIRFLLEISGYPKLGGAGLHIAHLLWGGLLMLLALLLLLAYLGHRIQRLAAVLGGLGFGIFVDELGKFITSDNNYFYRPTMALIYLIFIALFLVLRALGRQRRWSQETYLINALADLQEAVLHDLDAVEHRRARALLQLARGTPNSLAEPLSNLFDALAPMKRRRASPLGRLVRLARRRAHRALSSRWLPRLVSVVFFLRSLGFLLTVAILVAGYATSNLRVTQTELIAFAAALLSNVMGILGVASLLRSRLTAFAWFKRSVLLSIFVADVFAFYEQQLAAVSSLAVDVALFVVLNALLRHELAHRQAARADEAPSLTNSEAK
jgi:hypothetical protein